MAEISLKIKSDFAQAEADFKALIGTSEKLQKVNDVNSKEYKALSNQIDKYIEKNKLSTVAMTATQGKSAALAAEYKKLQTQIQTLINKGIDPMSPALDKLKTRMNDIQGYAPKVQSSFSGMLSSLGALGIGFGAYQVANKIIDIGKASLKAAANMETQTIAFTTMLGSAEKAQKLIKQLSEFAASTPFELTEVVDASKKLIAFGESSETVVGTIRRLGDVASGLSIPLGELTEIYGKARVQGTLYAEDLNQLAGRGIPIFTELAKVMNVNSSQVKKLGSEGKITFDYLEKVFVNLTKEGGQFGGLMEAQSATLNGQWSNFNDALGRSAVILGDKMAPAASELVTLLTHIASIDVNENLKNAPKSIGGFTGLLKIINNDLDGTKDKVNTIFDNMDQDKLDQIVNEVDAWESSSTGVSAKVDDILNKYGDINGAAVLYTRYVTDDIKLTDEQVKRLERILALRESIGAEAKSELESWRQRGLVVAAAKEKTAEKTPKLGGTGTKKSEEQIFQDRLNLMQNMELQSNAKRAKAAEDFFNQKMELEYQFGMDLVSWQLEQDALIENNARLTAEQKIAAHEAASKAIAERQKKDVKMYTDFGQHMLSNTGSILTDLQTVFKNAGKESKALGYMLKGVAIGEATINSYLAFTKALAAFPPPFNHVAAGITLAAGLAKVAAIASTPISAQTGLTSYEVPDVPMYRNDGAPVKAQPGETVSVTPRGETPNGGVTNISIKIGEAELFSIVQKGINTGEISVTNNNIGRGVFAN